jgi:hypothetical protein
MAKNGKPAATGLVADPAKVAAARNAIRELDQPSMMAFAMELATAARRRYVNPPVYAADGSRLTKGGPPAAGADPKLAQFMAFVEWLLPADSSTVAGSVAAHAAELRTKLPMPDHEIEAKIAGLRAEGKIARRDK